MRKQLLLALAILLAICGCTNIEDRKKLSEVRELLEHSPDSALLLLETSFIPPLMSERNLAEWCMLNGQARDSLKRDIDIDEDLFKRALFHYKKMKEHGNAVNTAIYLGKCYTYKGNYDEAIKHYLDALEISKKSNQYKQIGYILNYIGDIHCDILKQDEAKSYYEKASEYFLLTNNIRGYGVTLRNIAYTMILQEESHGALEYVMAADSIAHLLNDSLLIANIKNALGVVYTEIGEYELAEKYTLETVKYSGLEQISIPSLRSLCGIYIKQEKYLLADSLLELCKYELDDLSQFCYWYNKYLLNKEMGNADTALMCHEQSNKYLDIIDRKSDSIRVGELTKRYNYSKVIEENIILANRLHTRLMWIFILITIALLIYLIYNRKVNRKVHELEAKQRQLEEEEHNRKEQELKLKQQELEYQEKLLAYRQQKYELEKLIKEEAKTKQNLLRNSLIFKKINMLSELSTKNQDAFKAEVGKVMNSPSLSEHDWEEIKKEVNYVYPDFTNNLSEKITKLTEEEIRFCCLLKVGLETTELAILLDINPYSVNRRRSRINKKIRDVYPDLSWNEFLSQL